MNFSFRDLVTCLESTFAAQAHDDTVMELPSVKTKKSYLDNMEPPIGKKSGSRPRAGAGAGAGARAGWRAWIDWTAFISVPPLET